MPNRGRSFLLLGPAVLAAACGSGGAPVDVATPPTLAPAPEVGTSAPTTSTTTTTRPLPAPERIVFSSDRDGNFEIYTIDPSTASLQRLTQSERHEFLPKWSPNGLLIAFVSCGPSPLSEACDDGQLWVMEPTGDNARQISPPDVAVDTLAAFAWHPTDELLLYSGSSGELDDRPDLFAVAVDGSSHTNLTNSDELAETGGAWSPDGRFVAYSGSVFSGFGVSGAIGGSRVYVLDVVTGESVVVSPEKEKFERMVVGSHSRPMWWPDGQKILFENSHTEDLSLNPPILGCGVFGMSG